MLIVDALVSAGASPEMIAAAVRAYEEGRGGEPDFLTRERDRRRLRRERMGVSEEEWGRLRAIVFRRDGYRCVYCGCAPETLHCDHIVSVVRGGGTDLSNLATACQRCNSSKRDRSVEEWGGPCR